MTTDDNDYVKNNNITRRDFISLTATSLATMGIACACWPLIDSLNPSANLVANAYIEVDISDINPGQTAIVKWQEKPVFITHRTKEEIALAKNVSLSELKDPQLDSERVKHGKEEWLITIGICTHLGCIPLAHQGEFSGWLCPCHGSHYDSSGRIRKGPAPLNLAIPPYEFISDNKIKIG